MLRLSTCRMSWPIGALLYPEARPARPVCQIGQATIHQWGYCISRRFCPRVWIHILWFSYFYLVSVLPVKTEHWNLSPWWVCVCLSKNTVVLCSFRLQLVRHKAVVSDALLKCHNCIFLPICVLQRFSEYELCLCLVLFLFCM